MKLINVSKFQNKRMIFSDVNVIFKMCSLNCIIGKSGMGKTTLLNMMYGLDLNYEGIIEGNEQITYARHTSSLFENLTIKQLSKITHLNIEYAKVLNIYDLFDMKISKLSGGQRARVELLNAISTKGKLILIDEPTESLDEENSKIVINLLVKLAAKKTIIISTHDQQLISKATHVFEVKNCKLNEVEVSYND